MTLKPNIFRTILKVKFCSGILHSDKDSKSALKHEVELKLDNTTLDDRQKDQVQSLVSEYSDCFVNPADGILSLTD